MELFSIIIPVYNLENYIGDCLKSILHQTYDSYEVIVVDDGSSDKSLTICKEYSKYNNHIKVYHKNNGGVSSARNHGMLFAKGKYILFLDGDDFLANNALQNYANILDLKEYDLVVCAKNTYLNGEITFHLHPLSRYKNYTCNNIVELYFKSDSLTGAPWQYLYKRDIIIEDSLEFNCNYINGEDADFLFNYLIKDRTYLICNEPLVTYREMRDGSTTFTMSERAIISALEVVKKWHYYYYEYDKGRIYFANQYCKILLQISVSKTGCNSVIKSVDEKIIKESRGLKYYVLRMIWKVFGYKHGSKLVYLIKFKN